MRRTSTVVDISQRSFRFLVLSWSLSMSFPAILSQTTYSRTCDCQYMVDGKCAYTLLLPVSSSSDNSGTGCDVTDIVGDIDSIGRNISFLWQWMANQTSAFDELQSALIVLQNHLITTTTASTTTATTTAAGTSSTSNSSTPTVDCTRCEELVAELTHVLANHSAQLAEVTRTLASLATAVNSSVSTLRSQVAQLSQLAANCLVKSRLFSGSNRLDLGLLASSNNNSVEHIRLDSGSAWCGTVLGLPFLMKLFRTIL